MKKTLLVFLLVLVVLGGGSYYLLTSRVVDQLQQAQRQLAPIGTLQYGAVRITPGGTLQVNQLAFYPHASNDALRIERASLVTDNLFTLMQIASVVQQDKIPETLRFELKGVQMDFRGDWLANLTDSPSAGPGRHLYAAGCGERDYFSFADLDSMGYQSSKSDMSLEYRWSVNASRLLILGDLTMERMYRLAFNLDLSTHDDANNPMEAMLATQLRRAEFSYTNLGFTNSVIRYCAIETGLPQEVYLEQHLEAWQALWSDAGIVLGDELVEGYRDFIQQPESLTIEAFPGVGLMQLAMAGTPEATLDLIAPQMIVNQGVPRRVELAFIERPVERGRVSESDQGSESAAERPATSGRTATPGQVLAISELDAFRGRGVSVRLTDGRRYDGVIEGVESDRMQLRRILFNGQMVMPVRFEDIGEIRLRGS